MSTPPPWPAGITVLERGWLSSNNILLHAARDDTGAVLVDSGHVNHAEQTVQLVRHALAAGAAGSGARPSDDSLGGASTFGTPAPSGAQPLRQHCNTASLARLINTHLHSDHCGGNALLTAQFGMPISIPPGQAAAVRAWDDDALSYRATGQRMAPFVVDDTLVPGASFHVGGHSWQALAAPGHDPHSLMFLDEERGVLISADALWQDGFGVVFPEVQGEPGFDDVAAVLEDISALKLRHVIPGHGAPFSDVPQALDRARKRLQVFRSDPARHLRYAAKVFIKYHLMEEREMTRVALQQWALTTPLMRQAWERLPLRMRPAGINTLAAWMEFMVHELVAGGALAVRGDCVVDA
jgi:glyoxylase-like metal-dependent hydrolase (beta-lactamase superfamily II)